MNVVNANSITFKHRIKFLLSLIYFRGIFLENLRLNFVVSLQDITLNGAVYDCELCK